MNKFIDILRDRDDIAKALYMNPEYPHDFFILTMVLIYTYHDIREKFYLDTELKEFVIMLNRSNAVHIQPRDGKYNVIVTSSIDDDLREILFVHNQWQTVKRYVEGLIGICCEQ